MPENEDVKKIKSQKDLDFFWKTVSDLIDAAGDYASVVKLRNNLRDEATAFKVRPVFEKYYYGSMNCLCEEIASRERQFYAKLAKYDVLCRQNGLRQIENPKVFLDLLLDPKRRKSYKGRIKTKIANHEICTVEFFELSRRRRN